MRAMFINDREELLYTLQALFQDVPEIVYAECHSVSEAYDALLRHRPGLVFLDHELTRGGHEGWEILSFIRRVLPGTRVITTTLNPIAQAGYQQLGVEYISPMDYDELRRALTSETPPGQRNTASG